MTVADKPLKRITTNIYKADYEWLTNYYGSGYQVQIRHIIAMYVIEKRRRPDDEYD